jgi:hypothetical protein
MYPDQIQSQFIKGGKDSALRHEACPAPQNNAVWAGFFIFQGVTMNAD